MLEDANIKLASVATNVLGADRLPPDKARALEKLGLSSRAAIVNHVLCQGWLSDN